MPTAFHAIVQAAAALIEFAGGLFAVAGCAKGAAALVTGKGDDANIIRARLAVADGIIAALGCKTAATLLKTIELQTWSAIGAFAAIFALRTLVKRVLVWEEGRLHEKRGSV